jgi:hypothetical protein
MFDESTRVPLFIHHPDSPFKGKHYHDPVETIDIYPTITDLLSLPWNYEQHCKGDLHFGKKKVCHDLQGKSLARVVLGNELHKLRIEADENHKNNLVRGTKNIKRADLNGQDMNLKVLPVRRSLRSNSHMESQMSPLLNTHEYDLFKYEDEDDFTHASKESLHYYYTQWHMSDANTNSSTVPASVAKYFNGDNYFYLSSISYHNNNTAAASDGSSIIDIPASTFTPRHEHMSRSLQESPSSYTPSTDPKMPKLDMTFALSQSWRCAFVEQVKKSDNWYKEGGKGARPKSNWFDCDKTRNPDNEIAVMGYSMRTPEYRYTAWFHYNRKLCLPILDVAPFDEEVCSQHHPLISHLPGLVILIRIYIHIF